MRRIKFRGRSESGWHVGDLECRITKHLSESIDVMGMEDTYRAIIHTYKEDCTYCKAVDVDPDSVGQFTGLLDIHGKEIYEGDIVQRVYRMEEGRGKNKHEVLRPVGNCKPKVISFRMGAFGYVNFKEREYVEEEWLPLLDEECEVLGNIFDNPEIECGGD